MINKSNDLPSFVNENNLPKIVDKLSNASNIKITGNKYGNRVQTVIDKIVEKADDVTKAIKQEVVNDSYSFKVGTGDVDVSTDVEDGFGEVGVKGVTYQNLVDKKVDVLNNELTNSTSIGVIYGSANKLKQNTTYTIFYKIKTNQTFNVTSMSSMFRIDVFHNNGTHTMPYGFKGQLSDSFKVVCEKFTLSSSDSITKIELNLKNAYGDYGLESNVLTVKEVVILEGDHTNNPNLPSYFEGIVGIGDKSKNLLNEKTMVIGGVNSSTGEFVTDGTRKRSDYIPFEGNNPFVSINSDSLFFYDVNKTYISRIATTNGTSPANAKYVVVRASKDSTNIQLQYGSVATEYQPYGTHKIEILSNGDNIYDYTKITDNTYINTSGDIVNYTGWFSTDYIRVNKNKKYYFYNQKHRVPFAGLYCYYYDTNKNKIEYLNLGDTEFVGLTEFVSKHDGYIRLSGLSHSIQVGRMYASYDKTQILLDEPLMRLPNGVCDEITRDGKLIRRVGKIVFDGNENWSNTGHGGHSTKNTFEIKLPYTGGLKGANNLCYCNRFPQGITSGVPEEGMYRVVYNGSVNKGIFLLFSPKISEIPYRDTNAWKQWLSKNPTTVYYELAEPIVTELPVPYLRIFKDGHLTFNTLVAPESNHVVQLNKSAQIQNAIKESQSLDNRINVLENNYDNLMLSTISRLNDLELDYTLK